jgi:prepilin-type N-terminal cleavage/methylation domain-containing protein
VKYCKSSRHSTPLLPSKASGFTLVEVLTAMAVLSLSTLGILAALVQARSMTDFSRKQMLVDTMMQGILEQLKNRSATELLPNPVPGSPPCLNSMTAMSTYLGGGGAPITVSVELDTDTTNAESTLILSPDPYLSPASIPAGAIPADGDGNGFGDVTGDGVDDVGVNTIKIDVKGTTGLNGSTSITTDDIQINVMIWVKDYTMGTAPITVPCRAILLNYTWTYNGKIPRRMIGSMRAIKTPL